MSFNQFLTSMNQHQHAKNQAFTSFCSSDIIHLKILWSDWLRAFWPILLEPDFSQICDLCNNTADNIKFRYWPNSDKINNGFPINSTNPISGPFLGQKKSGFVCHTQHQIGHEYHPEFQKKLMTKSQSQENFQMKKTDRP